MKAPRKFGRDRFGRDLFLVVIDGPEELPAEKPLPSMYFSCLIVWDAEGEPNEILGVVCNRFLNWGGIWFNTWGSDCARVHHMLDWKIIDKFDSSKKPPYIETVWHDDEPVEDALWHFLWLAEPAKMFEKGCDAGLVVAINARPEVLETVRYALSDPKTFCAEETAKEFPDEDGG